MKKIKKLKLLIFLILGVISLITLLYWYFLNINIYLIMMILILVSGLFIYVFMNADTIYHEAYQNIENNFDVNMKAAFDYSRTGFLVYNDDYEITYQSELFKELNLMHISEKILLWLPKLENLLGAKVDHELINIGDYYFEVFKKDNAQVLFFRDVSQFQELKSKYQAEKLVLGYLNLDNYDESLDYNEDLNLKLTSLKQTVLDYLKAKKIVFKQIRANRFYLILNEDICNQMIEDRFSILGTIRNKAQHDDLMVTVSIALARGDLSVAELESLALQLLELAQSRGGDQVVMRVSGQDVKYFGGSSEAREKQSKVKVRVIAHSLKELIKKAGNVIIVGHEEADSDCVGASIVLSKIASRFNNKVFIANKTGGIEPMSQHVLKKYEAKLDLNHNFISQNEALNQLDDNTLVIMVDHHNKDISACKQVVNQAKKVVIIDHHRRMSDLNLNTILVYIEASASSSVELVCEFIPYTLKRFELTPEEANIAYLGILIDTNRFKNRIGGRTFDVLSLLKRYGADPLECEELKQEPYQNLKTKARLINQAFEYHKGIVITYDDQQVITRSLMSQACDELIASSDIFAAFVLAYINNDEISVSARSNGEFSVQRVMEKMHGGGHKTSAGLQVKNVEMDTLINTLKEKIDEYIKEDVNESNFA